FGVYVGLVQVRLQQGEQVTVSFGEVGAGPAEDQHLGAAAKRPGGGPELAGQAQLEHVLGYPRVPEGVGVGDGAVPLPGRVEVRDFRRAEQVAAATGIASELDPVPPLGGRLVDS